MKKIIIWTGSTIGFFIVIIGVMFGIMAYLEPVDEDMQMKVAKRNLSVSNQLIQKKVVIIDSLSSENNHLINKLQLNNLVKDSLQIQLEFKDNLISEYNKITEKLNGDLLALNKQKIRIKELAKTYETMKTGEMKPILENVDNETVLAIYNNMNSRTRKNILMALPKKRASAITQLIAKGEKKKTSLTPEKVSTPARNVHNTKPAQVKSKPDSSASASWNNGRNKIKSEQVKSTPDSRLAQDNQRNGYRVQLFTGRKEKYAKECKSDADQLLDLPIYIVHKTNIYKVQAGDFTEKSAAGNHCKLIQEKGFKDAWVVKAQIEIQLAHH
ncbi:MAG: SPOR domain-containing protein [Candidatus Hatepunaea meridiana]|nr:SPOR domain-containing protein [Candidatus Hatepunaea meridiana]